MEALSVFWLALLGVAVAYIEERFGSFQKLPANIKQLANAALTFVLPGIVAFLTPYWKPEFGDLPAFISAVSFLIVPVIVWLGSQGGHQFDRILQALPDLTKLIEPAIAAKR